MSEVRLVPQIYLQNFRDRTLGAAVCGRRVSQRARLAGHHAHAVVRRRAPVQWGHRALHPDPERMVSLAPSLRDPGRSAGDHRGLHPTLQRDHRTARLSDPGHRPTGAGGGGLTKATACPRTGCATDGATESEAHAQREPQSWTIGASRSWGLGPGRRAHLCFRPEFL